MKKNNETSNVYEEFTQEWKNGFTEGEICGEQSAVSRMILAFLNSDVAIKNKISGLNVKVDEDGKYELMWNFGDRKKRIKNEWLY